MRNLVEQAHVSLQVAPRSPAADAFAKAVARRPVLIAVPLYRRPDLARQVVGSLIDCAAEVRRIGGQVVLFNDSPDDPDLAEALVELADRARTEFSCRVTTNPANLGFVRTSNQAIEEAVARGWDLLLLNSDTVLTPGALSEMVRVARLDPMIGFVNPRSNNATLATLPYQDRFRHLPVEAARTAWSAVAERLPEMSYVPTAVGFCMLIRWNVLAEFGGFDEIYGMGYNEENDLVMRAFRRGYRAVLANKAFVWHEGHASFDLKPHVEQIEAQNRATLLARYPEYPVLTGVYFGSPEQRAEHLLGALIPDADGRLDVALDFSSFAPVYNGTAEAGAQLLAGAVERWGDRFSLYLLCSEEVYAFHDYARFGVPRRDPHGPEVYAAVFRVGQPYEWGANERLAMKAATFGVFMLDTISLDCSQLYSPRLYAMWNFAMEHADLVAGSSELTQSQLDRRFAFDPAVQRLGTLHSLDLEDYRLPESGPEDAPAPPGYLFVVGNHFWHKDVATTVRALAEAYPERTIVVLGGPKEAGAPADDGRHAPRGLEARPNVLRLEAGTLSARQMGALYANAAAIVFPSHYEGFGMPVLNALAARRPVIVRPLPVFEEMAHALGGEANIHVFATTPDLVRMMREPPEWADRGASGGCARDSMRLADEVGAAMEAMIAKASYGRIVRRIRAIQTLHDFANIQGAEPAATDRAALAARYAARLCERAAARILRMPGVFGLLRRMHHAVKFVRQAGRGRPAAA